MATHFGILAGESPWTEEAGALQPVELRRVGHDFATELTAPPHLVLPPFSPAPTPFSSALSLCWTDVPPAVGSPLLS